MRRYLVAILFLLPLYTFSQKITGTVTDTEGKILPYASVFVKGTNRGTNANSEGKFSMTLDPGNYIIVCQYVGYKKAEKSITVGSRDQVFDFSLELQEVMLDPVMLGTGEDPAYAIIRKTIEKKPVYQDQLDKFTCQVYTKGQLRVRKYPKRILGQLVDFGDGDTSGQKMLYLSETISNYSVEKPKKEKIEVISSRVSGNSDGYGLSAPRFFSFYDNNIFIGNNLNPRGFISPIADNALQYYKYKYEGEFTEDGRVIDKIKVIPRRKYEPLFSGYINIVEDEWRIHSLQLLLTKESQMELIDSLRLDQMYRPVKGDVWAISSQVIYPSVKILGFDAYGSFINIYSNFDIDPAFNRQSFNNTVMKYLDSSNKKTNDYWETVRPVPLQEEEIYDYHLKDSLEVAKQDREYLDSLDKVGRRINIIGAMLFEQTLVAEARRTTFTFRPITEQVSFNPAEGWVINTGAIWTKRLDSSNFSRRSITLAPNLRYGFLNKHFNAHLTLRYSFGRKTMTSAAVSGGKRVFQFNNYSPIGPRGNSLSSLLGENNRMKIYEAWYLRSSYQQGIGGGFSWTAGLQFQERMPLENLTDYTWRDREDKAYTPNYPNELVTENIRQHKVFYGLVSFSWQPGTRYIELPGNKVNIGSKYPLFSVQYVRNFKGAFGSQADWSKWRFNIKDDMNFKMLGRFSYRLGAGGFIDRDSVDLPDYQHFNGNISTFATEYLNSFQLLPLYQFSNTSRLYGLAHIEHNFSGMLTNKIPGLRKLNLYLVVAANGFYIDKNSNYFEYSVGFDNIFKQFRVDFVNSQLRDFRGRSTSMDFRIGFRRTWRPRGDDWP